MATMMAETSEINAPSYENALDWGHEEEESPAPPTAQQNQGKGVWQQEHENGGEAPIAAAKAAAVMEDLGRGLMFVRVPKSDVQDRSVEIAQQEFEIQLTTCRLLNENRRLKKLEKSDARHNTFNALADLKTANERVKAKRNELAPMRTANLQKKTARTALMESKRQIEATTEEELDALIKKVEYELEHVTLSLKEEKEHIAQLKRLKQQRPKIQTFALQHQMWEAKNNASEVVKGDQDQLEKEHKILKEEQAESERIYFELKAIETELDKELAEMNEEYEAATLTKNKAFDKLKAAREERRKRTSDFSVNRDLSRKVRELVSLGDLRTARDLCEHQTDRMIERLRTDIEYRKEYLRLWETQRKPLISFAVEGGSSNPSKQKAVPKSKQFTSMVDGVKTEPGQSIAEAVVARVMREAKGEAPGKASNVQRASESNGSSKNQVEQSGASSPAVKEAPKKKSMNPKPAPKADKVENDFVLPEVIVREVLNKKPDATTPSAPKKISGSLKDAKKEQANKKKLKKLEEKRLRLKEEKAAKEKADQQAREAELKAMQAKARAAESMASAAPTGQNKPVVRERNVVIPDPVIRRVNRKTLRSRPKTAPKSIPVFMEKYWLPLAATGFAIVLLAVSMYMAYV